MHSYHWNVRPKTERKGLAGNARSQFQGARAQSRHYRQKVKEHANHPIVKDLPDGWLTPEGELYNARKGEGTTVLAHGDNGKAKEPQALV